MEPSRVIFLSAVSNEFHNAPPERRHLFQSYRDVLKQAFRILSPSYEVIVQEDLVQGLGDLLATLENEVARSLLVIHLVGDMAGFEPETAALRNLYRRRPDLLSEYPELKAEVGVGVGITYTQWELYLAFHHNKNRLVFEARPDAPRSPLFATAEADGVSQEAHRRRIEATGAHRGSFYDQGDAARKAMRAFLHGHADPLVDPFEPAADDLSEAWTNQEKIVNQLAEAIRKPDPRTVPVVDPANTAAFVAAVRTAANGWKVNLATIVNIAARHEEQMRAAAADQPTFEAFYEEAFAQLALGDFTACRFSARRAADLALKLQSQKPEFRHIHREDVHNALLLLFETAKAAHDIPAAIAALEEAGSMADKEAEPLYWASIHEHLAEFLLEQAQWDRAEEIISDLIDIREDHQGENHPDLAKTLLLWTKLLKAEANYPAMESVAARAERISASQVPTNFSGIAAAINERAIAFFEQGMPGAAEPLMRQALAINEQIYEPEHPSVAIRLNNLAALLLATNRGAEAEQLMRRALSIDEQSYGPAHPSVAIRLNNLAQVLSNTDRLEEAELFLKRSLLICEQSYGTDHPQVAIHLNNLGCWLSKMNRVNEAEPLLRRALLIDEQSFGVEHPVVALRLNNLALLLSDANRQEEAESLFRQSLSIDERIHGPWHISTTKTLNNLACLLLKTGRPTEARVLMRRVVEILLRFTAINDRQHSSLLNVLDNYIFLLQEVGQSDEEIRSELNVLSQTFGLDVQRLIE